MQRLKITVACESCRKRKNKCSGTAPCTTCYKNGLLCEFRTHRQRRGPRPRVREASGQAPSPPFPSAEIELPRTEPIGENDEGIELATWSSCRDDLRAIVDVADLQAQMGRTTSEDTIVDTLCHLVEIFWSHVHNQQWPILDPRTIYQTIKSRQCPQYLCLAMCAASHRFSSHQTLREKDGLRTMDKLLAAMSRQHVYRLGTFNIELVQTLCVLILYEAAVGRGNHAWADTAFARGAIDVILNSPNNAKSLHDLETPNTFLIAHQHLLSLGHSGLSDTFTTSSRLSKCDELSTPSTRLLGILLKVHGYSEFDSADGQSTPWKAKSTFQNLWRELETFRLRNPADVKPIDSLFDETNTAANILAISVLSSLEWHCAVIILHRHLLAHVSNLAASTANIKTLETLRTANSDPTTTPTHAIPEPPFALLDAFDEGEESTSVRRDGLANNRTVQVSSIEESLNVPANRIQNKDERGLLHDYQCMLDEDLEDSASPLHVEELGTMRQSFRHNPDRSLEASDYSEMSDNDRLPAATHVAPVTTDATAVTLTSTNHFISSLPPDLMNSAFLESSLDYLHHSDPTFLAVDIQPGTLEQLNLTNIDLDGMDFWTSHLPPA
ncbi:hypothetical protein BDV19DRAFT_385390 [Aspergillus venezuelensis]